MQRPCHFASARGIDSIPVFLPGKMYTSGRRLRKIACFLVETGAHDEATLNWIKRPHDAHISKEQVSTADVDGLGGAQLTGTSACKAATSAGMSYGDSIIWRRRLKS